ncbi:AAA family ATPase [Streptomyces sp. NPDC102381]|uniref:AAA family ATPase n=1 Tax=Streptomyces sp. NPDC102381 TaxID=3366164 RepID=UPI0038144738
MTTTNRRGQSQQFLSAQGLPRRDTIEDWDRWRRTRHDFVPAPQLSLSAWRAMNSRDRGLHDLHRAATHANLPLLHTPMSRKVAKLLNGRIRSNAMKMKPSTRAGVMVTGGGYQGKTETTCEIAAAFEDSWRALNQHLNPDAVPGARDLYAPVAYVQTPVTAKPKSTCKAILNFYGAPTKNLDLPDLVRQVAESLHDHGTKALVLDDITRLRMHRVDDQDTLDLIRAFMSMQVTLVLIGVNIPASGLLQEGRPALQTGGWRMPASQAAKVYGLEPTQTERRFDLVELDRFRYDTAPQIAAWVQHLTGIEERLRLMKAKPGMLIDRRMPEYLFARTNGVVGLLERLVEDGCQEAMDTGTERLSEAFLDGIDIKADDRGRDPEAGEVPDVPPVGTAAATGQRPKQKPRRNPSTVFDDRGPAARSG